MKRNEIADFFRNRFKLNSDEELGLMLDYPQSTAKQNLGSYRKGKTQGIETRMIAILIDEIQQLESDNR